MEYAEIQLTVPPEATEAVAHLLHEAGTGGVVIEDERLASLRFYLPRDSRYEQRLAALRQALSDLVAYFPGMSEWREVQRVVADTDWANAWKAYYHPVQVGPLLIAPSWEHVVPAQGTAVIRLDPGMAFGTGTHATTVLCLEGLIRHLRPGQRVLDVGTGSGILAIAAARLGAGTVTALDNDPVAVRVARENVAVNHVQEMVNVRVGELPPLVAAGELAGWADLVVANIIAEVLRPLAPALANALRPGGVAIVSGLIWGAEEGVKQALQAQGLHYLETRERDDWVAITMRRPEEV